MKDLPDLSSQSAVDALAFRTFQANLDRLVETFGRNLADYKSNRYDEASLRQEFLVVNENGNEGDSGQAGRGGVISSPLPRRRTCGSASGESEGLP